MRLRLLVLSRPWALWCVSFSLYKNHIPVCVDPGQGFLTEDGAPPWYLRCMSFGAGAGQKFLAAQDVLLQEQPHKQAADPEGVNRQLHLCTRHPRRTVYAARIHRDGAGDCGSGDGGVCLEW